MRACTRHAQRTTMRGWIGAALILVATIQHATAAGVAPFLNVTLFSFSLTDAVPTPGDLAGTVALWSKLQADVALVTGAPPARVYLVQLEERREADPYPDIQFLDASDQRRKRLDHRITRKEATELSRTAAAGAPTGGGRRSFRTQALELARVTMCFLPQGYAAEYTQASSLYEDQLAALLQRWREGIDAIGSGAGLARGNITQFIHPLIPMSVLPGAILVNCDHDLTAFQPYLLACPTSLPYVYWGTTGLTIAIVLALFIFLVVAFTVWYFYNRQQNRLRRGEMRFVKLEFRAIVFGEHNTRFKQHTLDVWQPVWKPRQVSLVMGVLGLFLLFPLGVWFAVSNSRLVEVRVRYDHLPECDLAAGRTSCVVDMPIEREMKAPVYFYYHLTNFYQNHRNYVMSRSDTQLRHADGGDKTKDECSALRTFGDWPTSKIPTMAYPLADDVVASLQDKVLYPCGLIASSFFTDTFPSADITSQAILAALAANTTTTPASFPGPASFPLEGRNWLGRGISWTSDREYRFRPRALDPQSETAFNPKGVPRNHPTDGNPDQMLLPSLASEDLIVWMRAAPFSSFAKLNKQILDRDLRAGELLRVRVDLAYDVSAFDGEKALVLATTNDVGGSNPFLGVTYLLMACWYLATAVVLFLVYRHDIDPISPEQTLQLALDAQAESEVDTKLEATMSNAPIFHASRKARSPRVGLGASGAASGGPGGAGGGGTSIRDKNGLISRHAQ